MPSNACAPAIPVASAVVGAVATPRAIAHSRVTVDPVVRGGAIEGGVDPPRDLSHFRELVSMVDVVLLAPEVGEVGGGVRPAEGDCAASCAFRRLTTRSMVSARR